MQIAECLRQGLSAGEVADACGMELSVVQHRILMVPTLASLASKHGNEVTGKDIAATGMDELSKDAIRTLREVMLFGENENAKLKAAQFILSRFVPEARAAAGPSTANMPRISSKPEDVAKREERRARMKEKVLNAKSLGEVEVVSLVPLGDVLAARG